MSRTFRNLNHKRVDTYRVTHNERYNNFMIHPDLIYEDEILFVYKENGVEIQKKIPTRDAMKLVVKDKSFFSFDRELNRRLYKGHAYVVPEEAIFLYKPKT